MTDTPERYTREELEAVPLFRFVPLECVEGILAHSTILELAAGEQFEPGDNAGRTLHILLSGRLAVHYDVKEREDPLFLEQGEVVGEGIALGGPAVPCLLVAAAPSRIMVMEEDLIWSLAQVSHAAACNLLGILLRRRQELEPENFSGTIREYAIHGQNIVDPLTGFQTRGWLEGILERQLSRIQASSKPLSLIVVDIDGFRDFNERHGRLAGDRALHVIAQSLRTYLRPSELVARYAGDTFAILLPDVTLATARMIADRLLYRVSTTVIDLPDGTLLPSLSISVGIAEAAPAATGSDLVQAAMADLDQTRTA